MDIQAITLRMCVLFLLIIVGYIANKAGFMNAAFNKMFSAFIINVSTPALILNSVMGDERLLSNAEVFLLLGIAIASYILIILLSRLIPPILRINGKTGDTFRFMTIFSNVGFMGFPVVSALFGESAVFYAAIFNMPFNFLVFSYGVRLISGGTQGGFDRKTLLSPAIICSILAFVIYILNIPFPGVVTETIGYLANITIPGAMVIIGSSLALIPLKTVFNDWRVYVLSLIKLVLIPLAVWLIMRIFPLNPMIAQVTVVIWAMPVATNATMLATQYDGDESLASRGVLITTLLSVVTIPVMMWLLFIR